MSKQFLQSALASNQISNCPLFYALINISFPSVAFHNLSVMIFFCVSSEKYRKTILTRCVLRIFYYYLSTCRKWTMVQRAQSATIRRTNTRNCSAEKLFQTKFVYVAAIVMQKMCMFSQLTLCAAFSKFPVHFAYKYTASIYSWLAHGKQLTENYLTVLIIRFRVREKYTWWWTKMMNIQQKQHRVKSPKQWHFASPNLNHF